MGSRSVTCQGQLRPLTRVLVAPNDEEPELSGRSAAHGTQSRAWGTCTAEAFSTLPRKMLAADERHVTRVHHAMSNSHDIHTVSPELVLVDPELAVRERARLPVRAVEQSPVAAEIGSLGSAHDHAAIASATPSLDAADSNYSSVRTQSWGLPAGVAAAIAISLLLLDVRVDVGGNPASAESGSAGRAVLALPSAPPVAPRGAPPPRSSPKLQARRFAWAPVTGASSYRVEIHRGSARIFARETTRPQLTVPGAWKYAGTTQALWPGEYRWYVWGIESGRRSTRAVVQASLSIPAS